MLRQRHLYVTAALLLVGVVLLLLAAALEELLPSWLIQFLSNTGTAILALAILEFAFKTLLQIDLIAELVQTFKSAISLPVTAVYLKRQDLPNEQGPVHVIRHAKEIVYVRGVAFVKLVSGDFLEDLREVLAQNSHVRVRFLILSPHSAFLSDVASLTGIKESVLKASIKEFSAQIQDLSSSGASVEYCHFDKFPTCGIWLVDPKQSDGWCRIEPYLYYDEQPSTRANVVISKSDDHTFFQRLTAAVETEWAELVSERHHPGSTPVVIDTVDPSSLALTHHEHLEKFGSSLVVTFPTLNLSEIRSFYESADQLKSKGILGSDRIPPRTPVGILRVLSPHNESPTDIVLPRPAGFALNPDDSTMYVACQADNSIVKLSPEGIQRFVSNSMFNHLHSVDVFAGRLAVASTGTDCVIVFDTESGEELFRWVAIENGYATSPDGRTRILDQSMDHRARYYPTLSQTTHVNSVVVSREDSDILYATLFHQGVIIEIDMRTSNSRVVFAGLDHPHGLRPDYSGGYVVAQASSSRFLLLDDHFRSRGAFFDPEVSWLQDACALTQMVYAYADVNRSRISVVDVEAQRIVARIPYEAQFKAYRLNAYTWNDVTWLDSLR
jgi:hypothetical protein